MSPTTTKEVVWESESGRTFVYQVDWSFGFSPETHERSTHYEVVFSHEVIATRRWRRNAIRLAQKIEAGKL